MADKALFAPTRLHAAAVGILGMTVVSAFAQTIPSTGGEALRNIERSVPVPPINSSNGAKIQIPETPAMGSHQNNARVHVNGYRITGNTVFDESTLLPLIAGRTGDLSLDELQRIADVVAAYYRNQGYLLTLAYIPEQEIEQGTITIAVLEGRYDRIGVENHARVSDQRAQRILAQAICKADDCAGALIQRAPLERGLLLLNDTPGAHAAAQLAPGQRIGTSSLDVQVDAEPLATGSVQLDNLGGYYSGSTRAIGTVQLNSPAGVGDQLTVQGVAAAHRGDMRYGMLEYGLPLGYSGLRVDVRGSHLRYELGGHYAALNANGTVSSGDVALSYPFIRTLSANLHGDVTYGMRSFRDDIAGLVTPAERRLRNRVELGLGGDWRDAAFGAQALTTLSVLYTRGTLELGDPDTQATDAATARSAGKYGKWTLNYALQLAYERSSINVRMSAQGTGDNLDSYEKFALGGPYSVRAYPSGDTLADKAALVSVEWRHSLPVMWGRGLEGMVFYDRARGSLNAHPWTGDANVVTLDGAGVGVNVRITDRVLLNSTLAFRGNRKMTAAPDRASQFNVTLNTAF
jgi:hemolysin activation/secretion protein